jgi:hypothetical protein
MSSAVQSRSEEKNGLSNRLAICRLFLSFINILLESTEAMFPGWPSQQHFSYDDSIIFRFFKNYRAKTGSGIENSLVMI